jgi:hypothetical protein
MASELVDRPWRLLPADVAGVLRPLLPGLSDEIVAVIGEQVPAYRRPLEGPFGRTLRVGVEQALGRFVDLVGSSKPEDPRGRRLYVDIGRGEAREGRSLDAVLSAYRIGARLAWRRMVDAGARAGVEPDVLYRLGEAIFVYIDGLSAESAEGYALEQLAAAEEQQRRRAVLVRTLLAPTPDPLAVRDAADVSGWEMPAEVAVLAVAEEEPGRFAGRLGNGVVASVEDGVTLAVIPDPDAPGRRRQIAAALGSRRAALGPTVRTIDAGRSARRARLALRTVAAAGEGGLVIAAEHLPRLLLRLDDELAAEISRGVLEPLEDLSPGTRARLAATLRAWLDARGRVGEVATALGVHVQTVRYRLAQLRELFGERLESPDGRFELLLALRAREALGEREDLPAEPA